MVHPKRASRHLASQPKGKGQRRRKPRANGTSVVSVGYERRTLHQLISILEENRVGKLLDIREAAMSRRREFNKGALVSKLTSAGIEYKHLRSAGNPHRKEKADLERCLKLYRSYLRKNREVLDAVMEELDEAPVAFLCYERHHNNCHRSVLVDMLHETGHEFQVIKIE